MLFSFLLIHPVCHLIFCFYLTYLTKYTNRNEATYFSMFPFFNIFIYLFFFQLHYPFFLSNFFFSFSIFFFYIFEHIYALILLAFPFITSHRIFSEGNLVHSFGKYLQVRQYSNPEAFYTTLIIDSKTHWNISDFHSLRVDHLTRHWEKKWYLEK